MNETELESKLEKAWQLLEDEEVADATALAETLNKADPESSDVMLLLAGCAREAGDTAGAVTWLGRAAEADPEWPTPSMWMAELLARDPERLEEALTFAKTAVELSEEEDEYVDALALKAGIEVDLDRIAAARKTLSELPSGDVLSDQPELALEVAHLFLAVDDAAEAKRRIDGLVRTAPDWADAWHAQGIACESLSDEDGKRKAFLETLMLDKQEPDDRLLSDEQIEEEAEKALDFLPAKTRPLLQNVPIILADFPAKKDVADGMDPRTLGVFVGDGYSGGTTLTGAAPTLTQIIIFRRNLERIAEDPDELREELVQTLLHETGHFFGMSEADLKAVGLD